MKLYIKEHSYRNAKYKCEDCDFCGDNFFTMEVHNKKYHSENLECGLCEFLAKDKDELDTHLTTCEIYDCGGCYHRARQIGEIKDHIQNEHKNEIVQFTHGKMNINDAKK